MKPSPLVEQDEFVWRYRSKAMQGRHYLADLSMKQ